MDALTQEETEQLIARLSPQTTWATGDEPTIEAIATLTAKSPDDVAEELAILRHERRLIELDRERQEEERRLAEMKATREAAARAKETPEDAEARHQAWLERQRLYYEKANPIEEKPTPERVRRGWQAVDAADTEKPPKRRNPIMPTIYVILALLGSCLVLQVMSAVSGAGKAPASSRPAP